MKNILLCNNAMEIGGVETAILNQVIAFSRKGYNVYVIAQKGKYANEVEKLGGRFIEFDFPEENKIDEDKVLKLVKIIRENNINEIHIHKYQCIPTVMTAAFITNTPYLAYEHGIIDTRDYYTWNYPLYKRLFPIYFNNAYKIIAITPTVAERTQKFYNISKEKYEIIHNGIDFEKYNNPIPNYKNEIKNICIISRLYDEKLKSIYEGIDIFKELLKKDGTIQLKIIGGGQEENKVIEYIKQQQLSYGKNEDDKSINLLGEQTDIIKYLKQADLLLGVDRCVLEAIAMKVPAIITGYDGIKGLITSENINLALDENFSGNNMKTLTMNECLNQINKLNENKEQIINDNYNIAKEKLDCFKNYINIPDNTKVEINWIELFKLMEDDTNLIQDLYADVKAKYDWIQKIEKENKELYEKIDKLNDQIKQEKENETKIKEEKGKVQQELKKVYNSKRWRYTEKISKIFHKNNSKN